jgi:hypothetical protein
MCMNWGSLSLTNWYLLNIQFLHPPCWPTHEIHAVSLPISFNYLPIFTQPSDDEIYENIFHLSIRIFSFTVHLHMERLKLDMFIFFLLADITYSFFGLLCQWLFTINVYLDLVDIAGQRNRKAPC